MAEGSFVHLHVHTEYSMLDGAARISELVGAVAAEEMPAIAMTDHGNVFGAYEFWSKARAAGVVPIIGMEGYLTPGTPRGERTRVRWGDGGEDDVSGAGAYTHITLLAETTRGMHNLFRLASLASMEGYYFKPRLDRELLQTYSEGIIATTGCPGGEVQTRLRLGQYAEARAAADELREIFGRDNYFCEVMDHGIGVERRVQADVRRLAADLGLPLLATNDLHYTHAGDAAAHSALLCVQSASTLSDPTRFKFDGEEYYLKSAAQMRHLFAETPEACDNTLTIAERCSVDFNTSANYMPRFPVPEGESEQSWFVAEVELGLHGRYPNGIPDAVRKQADYEVDVITQMGFAGYFLVVADFINWSKEQGIRVGPGRGSGAGSIAAYAMRITDLDPLVHGLIFERFLNPDRVSMPDFDVDFDERRRGEVIRYVTERYGPERVAQIVTYGTIKAKQALKDSARVLGFPFGMGEKLTKVVPPPIAGKEITLDAVFNEKHPRYKETADLRTVVTTDPEAKTVFDTAVGLEGLKRQWGVHAAGVIMSSEPLIDIIPIMKREQDGQIVTQFDYPACEALGLIKMDFLGLRNLTIIDDALDNIAANRNFRPVLEDLALDDPEAYALLARGETLGVFQLDGGPLRTLLRLMRPDNFEDISAVIALYRPGPMGADSHTNYALRKNGQQPITPIHPELEEPLRDILEGTYGLIIYQEQVMAIAQRVAGFTLGQADILRRAMGKKKKSELDKQFDAFATGMIERGFSRPAVDTLWDILLPFSDYAFNKAHSAAYGVLSYWTAYLKANFPAEYMAALLTSVGDARDRLALYLNECRRMNIRVLAPDVNESSGYFTAVGSDIRFGLGAVRNVGMHVVDAIRLSRTGQGNFTSFHDYLKKVPAQATNKRAVESLIKAGAFDSLGDTRRALIEIYEPAVEQATRIKRDEEHGNVGFDFDTLLAGVSDADAEVDRKVPTRPEWPRREKLGFEREMLGLYVTDHPLAGLERDLAKHATATILELQEQPPHDSEQVTVAGLITAMQSRVARQSGNPYGIAQIEDFTGEMSVMLMGRVYQEFGALLHTDVVAVIKGRVVARDDGMNLHAQNVCIPDTGRAELTAATVTLTLADRQATPDHIRQLGDVLRRHHGDAAVRLRLKCPGLVRVFELPHQVLRTPDLVSELKVLFGADAVR